MNTHKEEPKFKVGDRVKVSKGLNKEQAGTIEKLYYEGNIFKVRMEAGGWEFFRRGYLELAPLEPKEEREYQEYKKAEEKRIYDIEHDYVRPTPPSQIEEVLEKEIDEILDVMAMVVGELSARTFDGQYAMEKGVRMIKEEAQVAKRRILEAINKLTKE